MNAADYDAWYDTPRGRWIGETEFRLLHRMLVPALGETVLDVGCGTGWFTAHLAQMPGLSVTGLDPNITWLVFARERDGKSTYLAGNACTLPFADKHFDRVLSVTALCFIPGWTSALAEIVRVTRKRFAIGLLNRTSLLWHDKGRHGGEGAYRGAHWHTAKELRLALNRMPVKNIRCRTAIFIPSASRIAIMTERALPNRLPFGGFLLVTGDVN